MAVMDLVAVQGLAVFMARAVVQILAFRGIQAVIVSNSLVKEGNSSSSWVIKAIRSSWIVGTIMCLSLACANVTRRFIRGL